MHHDFDMQLIVKLSDEPVDSIIISFRSDFGLVAEQDRMIANDFELQQNYPNPFNPSTKLNYQLPERSFVTLKVYDILGNEVATLVNEEKPAGSYEVDFTVRQNSILSLSSGIYFYQLKTDSYINTKKMIIIK